MENYSSGTVLTCSHGGCGCRVRVESECHCADAGQPYICTCGSPMTKVVVDEKQVVGSSAE
jgi:metallothionein